jgi:hypothetical protein
MDDEREIPNIPREQTFADLCSALRRNDPSVTEVTGSRLIADVTRPVLLTNANARRLGEDLQGNSHVASMSLDPTAFEDDAAHSDALLLHFIRESLSLKYVKLSFLGFWRRALSVTIVRRFFFTIAESSTIQTLELQSITIDPIGFDRLMKTTRSLKKLILNCDFGNVASRGMAVEAIGAI